MTDPAEKAALHYLQLTMLGLLLTDPVVYQTVSGEMVEMVNKHKLPQRKRCTAKFPPRPKVNQYPIQCWVEVKE